jgi:tRNA nucleotidyltransferase (CCA-adding enzyme)
MNKIDNNKIPYSVIKLISVLMAAGYEAYLTGDCVRNLIMNKISCNFNISTNAMPDEIKNVFKQNCIDFDEEFSTILVNCKMKPSNTTDSSLKTTIQVNTYKSINFYDNAIQYEKDIHKDLMCRDFSINAIAYNPITEELIDDHFGIQDIHNKIIRCVGKADDRFNEDALNILRALRLAVEYDFKIADTTKAAMFENKSLLNTLPKKLSTNELRIMLTCNKPIADKFLEYQDIIGQVIPELKPCFNFNPNNRYKHNIYEHMLFVTDNCKTDKFEIKLAALLHDIGKPHTYSIDDKGYINFCCHAEMGYEISKEIFANDLSLTVTEQNLVEKLIAYHDIEMPRTADDVEKILNTFDEDFLDDWIILKQADVS